MYQKRESILSDNYFAKHSVVFAILGEDVDT